MEPIRLDGPEELTDPEGWESQRDLDAAYDAMGPWRTWPECAVASHPRRKRMTHAEKQSLYRREKR